MRYKYQRGDWRAVVSDFAEHSEMLKSLLNACFVWPSQTLRTLQNPEPSGSEAAVLTANKSDQSLDGHFSNETQGDAVSASLGDTQPKART